LRVTQLLILALLVVNAGPAKGTFMIVSQSAVFNPTTQQVLFTIAFNEAPDFTTVDAFGRQADSFQYYIPRDPNGDPTAADPSKFMSIIRGEEIHITIDTLRIRNAVPSSSDPAAGGWGTIRGAEPFILDGNVLTFSAPIRLINPRSTDGRFRYELDADEFGASSQFVLGHSISLADTDSSELLFVLGLIGIAVTHRLLRERGPWLTPSSTLH